MAAVLFAGLAAPGWGEALYATFRKPVPGLPVFGDVEVVVHVAPAEAVETVELFVDGRFVRFLEAPGYRAEVDVGEENAEHRFEVVARGAGEPGRALLVTPKVRVDEELELRLQQLYVTVTRDGRPVHASGYRTAWRDSRVNRRELEQLEELVTTSGGKVEVITTVDESLAAFKRILEELREQYALGYYPSNALGDGKWHKVEVRLRRPGHQVRAREGYLDD